MPAFSPADDLIPAIGYIRVSMAREEMISPELQREAILAWAKRTRHRIVDWIEDLDKTGRNFKRRIMQAIERVERGEVNVIAVWKYSRFGRTRPGIELNLARIETAGGQLLSATEEVDATTATGWFQRDVIFSVATFESKRAGEQWKETHDWRRDNGLPASGMRRFGYTWHQRKIFERDGTVRLQEERYEPNPETGPVLADIYQRYIDGESHRALAIWLNNNGFRTTRDNKWTVNGLIRYLDSGFPAGYLRFHAGCQAPDCVGACDNYQLVKHPTKHHPPLITEETWRRYQQRRQQAKARPRRGRSVHPFSGLLTCKLCGGGMKRVGAKGSATRFCCRRYDDYGPNACAGTRALIADVDQAILEFLQTTVAPEIDEDTRNVEGASAVADRRTSPEAERARLETQMAQLDRAIGKAMRTWALSGEDDPAGILEAEYQKLLAALRDEKAQLGESLKQFSPEAEQSVANLRRTAVAVALGLLEEWETLQPVRLNALLGHVIERVVVLPDFDGLEIYPAWTLEPWTWQGGQRPVLKRELIAELWKQHPEATGREVADRLAAQGVSVTPTYVLVVRGKMDLPDDGSRVERRYGQGGSILNVDRIAREQVRLEAAKRLEAGESVDEVAAALCVTKRTVHRWRKAWRERGEVGLLSTALPRQGLVAE